MLMALQITIGTLAKGNPRLSQKMKCEALIERIEPPGGVETQGRRCRSECEQSTHVRRLSSARLPRRRRLLLCYARTLLITIMTGLSLPEIKSGRIDGAVRRGAAWQ